MSNTDNQKVSDAYKKIATEQPPGELDSIILAAAHSEAPKKSNVIPFNLIPASWIVPLTVAATVVLGVGILLTIPDADFQKNSEHDYVIPNSMEEQKRRSVAEVESEDANDSPVELRKKFKAKPKLLARTDVKQEKNTTARSLGLADMQQAPTDKKFLLKNNEPNANLAVTSQPARAPSMKLDESVKTQLGSAAVNPAVRSPASKSARLAPAKMARKKSIITFKIKEFLQNIKKVMVGMKKAEVYKLLGTPQTRENDSWQYQYIISGAKKDYFIKFKNNLVTKVEK